MEEDPLKKLIDLYESKGYESKEAVEKAEMELDKRRRERELQLRHTAASSGLGAPPAQSDTANPENYLDRYKLNARAAPNPKATTRFPRNHFGTVALLRKELISHLADVVTRKTVGGEQYYSHYFRGLPGSGKTSIALLLGHRLKAKLESCVVFYFKNSSDLDKLEDNQLMSCIHSANEAGKTAVFIVDEADQNPTAARWTTLLKPESNNLITIGFGVPVLEGISSTFDVQHQPREVCYSLDNKSDIQELVEYWAAEVPHISKATINEVCCHVCTYTSGQSFAFLRIVELLLTEYADSLGARDESLAKREKAAKALAAGSYVHYLNSDACYTHQVVRDVKSRCFRNYVVHWFSDFQNVMVPKAADGRSLASSMEPSLVLLEKNGFWDKEIQGFFSLLLHRVVLETVPEAKLDGDNQSFLDIANRDKQDIIQDLIVRGLARMTDDNFFEDSEARVENGISSAWAYHMSAVTKNITVSPQSRGERGHVDYVFNKSVDVAIEVVKESSSSESGIKVMDQHVRRFVTGQYPWKHNAVLNFNMKTPEVIFPSETSKYPINHVFTYVHLTRQLYRGKNEVKVPGGVVPKLRAPAHGSPFKGAATSGADGVAVPSGSQYDRRQRLRYADYDPTSPPASPSGWSSPQTGALAPGCSFSESSNSSESVAMDFTSLNDSTRRSEDYGASGSTRRGQSDVREREGVITRKRSAEAAENAADDSGQPSAEDQEENAKISADQERSTNRGGV